MRTNDTHNTRNEVFKGIVVGFCGVELWLKFAIERTVSCGTNRWRHCSDYSKTIAQWLLPPAVSGGGAGTAAYYAMYALGVTSGTAVPLAVLATALTIGPAALWTRNKMMTGTTAADRIHSYDAFDQNAQAVTEEFIEDRDQNVRASLQDDINSDNCCTALLGIYNQLIQDPSLGHMTARRDPLAPNRILVDMGGTGTFRNAGVAPQPAVVAPDDPTPENSDGEGEESGDEKQLAP